MINQRLNGRNRMLCSDAGIFSSLARIHKERIDNILAAPCKRRSMSFTEKEEICSSS